MDAMPPSSQRNCLGKLQARILPFRILEMFTVTEVKRDFCEAVFNGNMIKSSSCPIPSWLLHVV